MQINTKNPRDLRFFFVAQTQSSNFAVEYILQKESYSFENELNNKCHATKGLNLMGLR
jgi:hypothetical protein